MDTGLAGKKAVITASTDGIGYATARRFLEEDALVLINGRNESKAREKRELLEKDFGRGRVFLYIGDATSECCIREMRLYAEKVFGNIDCIVANAGSGKPTAQSNLDLEGWKKSFDINLFGTVRLMQEFDSLWDKDTGGSVVAVSSLAAYNRISAPYAYAAAKQSVSVFAKYLSDDYAKRRIRVNSIVPGNVYYEGGRWDELVRSDEEGVMTYIEKSVPMKRFGYPGEIADAIVFLASDRASFINGATLAVDGGQSRMTF